jgi:hypothetical protein
MIGLGTRRSCASARVCLKKERKIQELKKDAKNGFCQDALFIFSGVGPPLCFGNYFWVRPSASGRIGARFGWRCTRCGSLRSPSLRSAPAKPPGERTTPRELISAFFFLALLIN